MNNEIILPMFQKSNTNENNRILIFNIFSYKFYYSVELVV